MSSLRDLVPGYGRLVRLPGQIFGFSPFAGDIHPTRVPLFGLGLGRPTLPFPHPGNYDRPLEILETYFWGAESEQGTGRHNRYLNVPGFSPVLVTRDPGLIRAITTATSDQLGDFDRDTLPSTGIARATGKDSLLYSNGPLWRRQRKLAAPPFGKTTLFQPEMFHEFEATFRHTVSERLDLLRKHLAASGQREFRVRMEPEIKAVMLEMLANNFFGAAIGYEEIRNRHVPALERVINHIVRDTVTNKLGVPIGKLPGFSRSIAKARDDFACFEQLTDLVMAPRRAGHGLWKQFKSDAPDELLRSNIKVFLAGALEATTSFASWVIAHLARVPAAQDKVLLDVREIEDYSPENLARARYFDSVLNETLRLTPSLYFLPRRATADTLIETADERKLRVPKGTHILLDVWHANRHEDYWGVSVTGFPAVDFAPERWANLAAQGRDSKDILHFGFGHGPRVCPGKHLGQLEVALVVGAFVKMFKFRAVNRENPAKAGVSTKPADGTLVDLELRSPYDGPSDHEERTLAAVAKSCALRDPTES
jgi:cytochrome P450